jgi:toluene monooxygenase system protein E
MSAQRTYWHLEGRGRVPSDYEVTTSKLLYYPERGFEVNTPIGAWYERHQTGSRLRATWAGFSDPRETTYARYVELQDRQEAFVDELLRSVDDTDSDAELSPDWLSVLDAVLPVLRYPAHALHMSAAYVGSMAPEGRVVVSCALQAADEMRRIQRFAYRMRQLQEVRPNFGDGARSAWQTAAGWQPLRRVLEHLLCTYDFGEAAIALNLVVKPAFDRLFMFHFARHASERGDALLAQMLGSLARDCSWQRAWTGAFVRAALAEREDNQQPIVEWISRWWPPMREALIGLTSVWGIEPARAAEYAARVATECQTDWSELGFSEALKGSEHA